MSPDQPTRQAILQVVRERRGLHKSELARLVGIGWGNVGHHVHVLRMAGLVRLEGRGKYTWVFDPAVSLAERELLIATQPSSARRLLELLGMREHATVGSLSEELALSKKQIRHHLGVLHRVGAVQRKGGNPPVFRPNAPAQR